MKGEEERCDGDEGGLDGCLDLEGQGVKPIWGADKGQEAKSGKVKTYTGDRDKAVKAKRQKFGLDRRLWPFGLASRQHRDAKEIQPAIQAIHGGQNGAILEKERRLTKFASEFSVSCTPKVKEYC
ncbi:hypothetical protein NDA14_002888 [Ustilago hordei]|nr:hypothetical protein NDA14_002888 [Ustilago hordei]